jgi:hypothetical protein
MSGWRGPGGPPPGASAESAFQKNLRETAAGWRQRLERSHAAPQEANAIGTEAGELRTIAASRGWGATAQQLQNLQNRARESPAALTQAIAALDRFLAPAVAAQGSGPIGIPPETVRIAAARGGAGSRPDPASVPPPPLLDLAGPPANSPSRPPPEIGPTLASLRGAPSTPPLVAAGPALEIRRPSVDLPESTNKPQPQPKLLVKTVLGFRAFGKKASRESGLPPEEPPHAKGLLGLGRRPAKPSVPSPARPSPPPRSPDFLAERVSPRPSPLEPWRAVRPRSSGPPPPRRSRGSKNTAPRWVYFLGGVIAVLAVSTVLVVVVNTRDGALRLQTAPDAAVKPLVAPSDPSAHPTSDPMADEVHRQGQETAELRALIDQQSRMLASCRVDATKCDKWAREALLLTPVDAKSFVRSETGQPLSAWLQRLKIPHDFPAKDDPALAAFYGYDAKHPTGRANFQLKLFRCSKFDDIFEMTLVKYGAPAWLKAVVYQESGCDPLAASPVGARGLWQFMAESARAYGLLVNERGEVDERLDPVKSTDAAIHFLMDLYGKLGAWDLALAGYNMGPYGVTLRIAQVGGHAGFWDLRRSDLLPAETADYVPSIEAYALILENRRSLGFPVDVPLPESTSELNVKPGTRLSLIARVARTSTTQIKEHNLDFLGQVVPAGETTARVPLSSDQILQVQQALDNWPDDDTRDTCAPPDYVWGSGDFETTPYAKKCHPAATPQ